MKAVRSKWAALVLVVGFYGSTAAALPVIDQNQPNAPSYMAHFSQSGLAQSFRQSYNNIAGAGIFLVPGIGSSGPVTISLWDVLSSSPNANLLASASGTGTSGTWFDIFWSPVAVTPGTTYFLVFSPSTTNLGIAGDTNNPYPNGMVFANAGFGQFPTYDYTFRTFYENGFAPNAVPEPATLALFGAGLLGVGLQRRRRKS